MFDNPFFGIAFVLGVLGLFFVGFPYLMSYLTGWTLLAKYFCFPHQNFIGYKIPRQMCVIRSLEVPYGTTIGADETGLFLKAWFLTHFGGPALFIPWDKIKVIYRTYAWHDPKMLRATVLEVDIGKKLEIMIPFKTFENIEHFMPTKTLSDSG